MGSSAKGGPQPAPPPPIVAPPNPMEMMMPMMQMMMQMQASALSSIPEMSVPELPEPYKSPFKDWEAEREQIRSDLKTKQSENPRRGGNSTVVTSLLDRPDGTEETIKTKLGD